MSAEINHRLLRVPSLERMCDALKYGYDPIVKFRIHVTLAHSKLGSSNVLREIQVLSIFLDSEEPRQLAHLDVILHGDLGVLTGAYETGPVAAKMRAHFRFGNSGHLWVPKN